VACSRQLDGARAHALWPEARFGMECAATVHAGIVNVEPRAS